MADTISKIIGIILAFVLLVFAPMTISRMTDDMAAKRCVLNEVEMFIDRITDKSSVSGYDVNDLLLGINLYGGTFDAEVTHYKKVAVSDGAGGANSIYIASDFNINTLGEGNKIELEQGDAIQVKVTGIGITKGQSLLQVFFHVIEKPFEFSLAGTVR